MKKQTCTYLGMQEDPTTALDFPSEGNFCHRAEPTAPVNKVHQQRYCLTAGHYGCPVYRAARPGAMPPELLPPAERVALAATVTNRLPGFLLPGIIIGVAVLGLLLWVVAPQVLGIKQSGIPNTGQETPDGDTSFNLFSFGDARDETWTPFAPQFGGNTGEMVVPNCPQPAGWMPYITNPTDSLFRLSVVYGVPVEDLQRANCKDTTDTVILPGQVIYVPATAQGTVPSSIFVQEPTAFPTFTPARPVFIPQPTSTSSRDESKPNTPVPTIPSTNTPRPTATRVTATATRAVSSTPTRFVTPTKPTATLRPTNTPVLPTATPKPTNTRVPTRTPRPSRTPTPVTPTNTPVPPTATPEPTNTPRPTNTPTDPPPTNTPRPTDPPPTNTPVPPTDPPPTDPPPTDTPQPTDPPPTDPPPTDPPPTEEPPPTSTDPPPAITEPVQPTETEPPTEEATPTDPLPSGSIEQMRFELF